MTIHLTPAPNTWEGPQTLHHPRTVATCTVVIFALIGGKGGGGWGRNPSLGEIQAWLS